MNKIKNNKKIILIRHGKTEGNFNRRYIGRTDEPLFDLGKKEIIKCIEQNKYPKSDLVVVSPMKRCIETANIIYPNQEQIIIDDLRECDFGNFENKNYQELCNDKDYQDWINSNGEMTFPNGESIEEFKKRCCKSFVKLMKEVVKLEIQTIALIVHGGTVMSIMSSLCNTKKSYYDWMIKNSN